jgi:hypothetical protein
MSFVLLVLGTVIAAVGIVMIGFGIPINEFSLGNTLIIAGTTALVGGLIVTGLGAAIRQLRRIAESQTSRPALRPTRISEPFDPVMATPARAASASSRPSFPPRPRNSPMREARGADGGIDRARPAVPLGSRNDFAPPMVDDNEDVPLSPLAPPRSPPQTPPLSAEAALEIRSSRSGDTRPPRLAGEGVRKPAHDSSAAPASERATERPPPEGFDTVWPADSRAPREAREDVVHPPRAEPAAHARSNGEQAPRPEPSHARMTEPVAVSILKSGVVDGMAYTLYTDGSIEAELAQGVVRFASIEELRNHLEKSG